MEPDVVIDIFRHTLFIIGLFVSIVVGPGLMVGLLVAVFQAATQINEMSMSFVPKFLVTLVTIAVLGSWLVGKLVNYTIELYENIPSIIG